MAPEGYSGPIEIEIDRIDPSPACKMRARVIDKTIQDYANNFDDLPPIQLVAGSNDMHWTADGSYRLAAAILLGRKTIKSYIKGGTEEDAWYAASRANGENRAERITSDDRVARVLACHAHPVMGKWSLRRIAEYCNERYQFVGHVLQQRVRTGHVAVEGRDGKTYLGTRPAPSRKELAEKRDAILGDLKLDHAQPDTILAEKHGVDYRMVAKVRKENQIAPSGAKGGGKYHKLKPKPETSATLVFEPEPVVIEKPVTTPAPVLHQEQAPPTATGQPKQPIVEAGSNLSIDDRWKPIRQQIKVLFESWSYDDRPHFAHRLMKLSDEFFDLCPQVEDLSGDTFA